MLGSHRGRGTGESERGERSRKATEPDSNKAQEGRGSDRAEDRQAGGRAAGPGVPRSAALGVPLTLTYLILPQLLPGGGG